MGWASGLQAGMRLGETIRQGQLERDLAEEAKKYKVTEGAYGPELGSNIEQLRGLQQQNPEQAAQYEAASAAYVESHQPKGPSAPAAPSQPVAKEVHDKMKNVTDQNTLRGFQNPQNLQSAMVAQNKVWNGAYHYGAKKN